VPSGIGRPRRKQFCRARLSLPTLRSGTSSRARQTLGQISHDPWIPARGQVSRAELPGDHVAREVVEHGGEIEPAPAGDLEVGEVGLPELVGCRGLGVELVCCLDHDESRAGDQVVLRQQAVDRSLGDEVALAIGEAHGKFSGRQFGLGERQVDDAAAHRVRDAVPDSVGARCAVECIGAASLVAIIPAIERGWRDAEVRQRAAQRQAGLLDQATGGTSPSCPEPPPVLDGLMDELVSAGFPSERIALLSFSQGLVSRSTSPRVGRGGRSW